MFKGVFWIRGVQSDFSSPFAHSGWEQFLESGEGCANDSLSSTHYPPSSSEVRFGSWAEPELLMCRGQIQWWQSRTVSAVPVAGWTSSAGEGSTTSAGPFSQWTRCDCPTSGPAKLWCPGIWMTPLQSQCCSCRWVGESRGVTPEVQDHLHSFERVKLRLLRLHQTASS